MAVWSRGLATSPRLWASAPKKGRAQGFVKNTSEQGPALYRKAKRITPGTLYKKWEDTIHTGKFGRSGKVVELLRFKTRNISECLNKIVRFSDSQRQTMAHLGSFHKGQFRELFPYTYSLVRESTTQRLLELLENVEDNVSRKLILTGEPGVGKSTLLAQAHSYASDNQFIIIHVSYPDLFLNGRTPYVYRQTLNSFAQPSYLKKLMDKITKANNLEHFEQIKLKNEYKFVNANPQDSGIRAYINLKKEKNTLLDLLRVKTSPQNRGELFDAFIKELSLQDQYPVLFSVDNFSKILTTSFTEYKNVKNRPLFMLELQMGKCIMDIVAGNIAFPHKKSFVLLATSGSDRTNRTLPLALGKTDADPYISRYHCEPLYVELLKKGNVQEFEVTKLGKDEVATLIEFYLQSDLFLHKDLSKTKEELVNEKYFLSGNGNPRELLKSIVLMPK